MLFEPLKYRYAAMKLVKLVTFSKINYQINIK